MIMYDYDYVIRYMTRKGKKMVNDLIKLKQGNELV